MKRIVTGAAGMIGSLLVERSLADGHQVVGIDNLSRGRLGHLSNAQKHSNFTFFKADLASDEGLQSIVEAATGADEIWHMAANSDIPAGIEDPAVDLDGTFLTTYNSLTLARKLGIGRFLFASSSAIYGDLGDVEISEDSGPLFPISNYGAMKLASEALITAAVEKHLEQGVIFRFPNVVGVPATHGVILDFVHKLQATPARLDVMGDGTQRKSYIHADELVQAMEHIATMDSSKVSYVNIGPPDSGITVANIADIVRNQLAPNAEIKFGKGNKGWVGDVPKFRYSIEKLRRLGWSPKLTSYQAVERAVEQIIHQESGT